jgi:type IV pilus assembly protein PilA
MKKTQKKLGNKGFSLVELIVVIAIMAVLVGVLAPTLIKNIEQLKSSAEIALNNESAYASVVPSTGSSALVTLTDSSCTFNTQSDFSSEFTGNMDVTKTKLTSKKYSGKTVTINVNSLGQVSIDDPTASSASK